MSEENSEEYLNTSDSDWDSKPDEEQEKPEKLENKIKAAIIDWDNTLFPTGYFDLLLMDYKGIFSEEKSIEDSGAYLIHELQSLEEVSVIFFKNHLKFFRKF